jgi:hypothetical protein
VLDDDGLAGGRITDCAGEAAVMPSYAIYRVLCGEKAGKVGVTKNLAQRLHQQGLTMEDVEHICDVSDWVGAQFVDECERACQEYLLSPGKFNGGRYHVIAFLFEGMTLEERQARMAKMRGKMTPEERSEAARAGAIALNAPNNGASMLVSAQKK